MPGGRGPVQLALPNVGNQWQVAFNLPGAGGAFKRQNLNLYQYSFNNPVVYSDPDGNAALFWHYAITLAAGLKEGLGWKSFSLAWKTMMADYTKQDGRFSLFASYVRTDTVQNWHGALGPDQDAAKGAQAVVNNGNSALQNQSGDEIGSAPWGVHTVQDVALPDHRGKEAPKGILGNLWHTLGDLFPVTSLGKMWNNTVEAIRSMKSGTPVGITPEGRVNSNPSSGSGNTPESRAPPNE